MANMLHTTTEREYEVTFVASDLADDTIDLLYDLFDCLVSTHSGVTLVTITCEGSDPVTAGVSAAHHLSSAGVEVRRTHPDLVDRGELARRAGVTPQAVGNWIRGARQTGVPFPAPAYLVSGGAWLWGDINRWLEQNGKPHDEILYPSLADHARIDTHLAAPLESSFRVAYSVDALRKEGFKVIVGTTGTSKSWVGGAARQADFALAV
jgi:hypothetical protein